MPTTIERNFLIRIFLNKPPLQHKIMKNEESKRDTGITNVVDGRNKNWNCYIQNRTFFVLYYIG